MSDETERRLAVLESVLGIDPEVKCRGAGDPCPDICEPSACPLHKNNVQGIARLLSDVLDECQLIRCWAEDLESRRAIPEGSWDRASLRLRLLRLNERLERAREIHTRLGTVAESPFTEGVAAQIHDLQREQADLQAALAIGGTK